ncbi:MAG: trigger factor [Bryobacterales bacterium]|nr:trigger factor [Bryobacterales bacterium]
MSEEQSCKRTMELTISLDEVNAEIARVESEIQKKVKMPGFRPGKVPMSMVRSRFESDIRQEVVESLVPKAFRRRADEEQLAVVGSPNVTDVHFHKGEPLRFKAEFEVAPQFELGEYRGLTAPYSEPKATDEDITARLNAMREQKAEFVNVAPRPLVDGDYAVVALQSVAGLDKPMEENELTLHLGDAETLPEFSENLLGLSPGEEKEFDVQYPENYGNEKLSNRKVRFLAKVKGVRKKELPELNDEFAKDVGDFQSLEELQAEVRKAILREREHLASQEAKAKLVDALVESHQFAVPDAFVDRQIEMSLENRFRELAQQGIDPRQLKINWEDVKKAQAPQATKDVKASLLLDKIADREAIETTNDEVDREVQRLARQLREPVAATRMKLEKEGALRRIALRIRTEKVLNFLFENARKVAPAAAPPAEEEPKEA